MILTMDVDLAREIDSVPYRGKVWMLFRWEGRVLGEIMMDDVDLTVPTPVERKALQRFAPQIHALGLSPTPANGASVSVSVAVVVGESAALLDGCLDAIAAADPPPLEVLLVSRPGVVPEGFEGVLLSPSGLPGEELARIAQAATGQLIAVIDERCRPDRRFIASLRSASSDASPSAIIGIIAPTRFDTLPQLAFDLHVLRRGYRRMFWSGSSGTCEATSFHPLVGGGIAYRRADLIEVGFHGLDTFQTRRQVELAMLDRLLAAGKVISHHPDVVTWHVHPRSRAELLGWVRAEARDRMAYMGHAERLSLRRVSSSLWTDVVKGVRSARRGRQLHLQVDLVTLATTSTEAWRHVRARGSKE